MQEDADGDRSGSGQLRLIRRAWHVDHSKNVWVGCEYDSDFSLGNVLEYNSGRHGCKGSYTPSCPSPVS